MRTARAMMIGRGASASGAISGSTAFAFSASGTVSAIGIRGSSTLGFSASALLQGKTAISGSSTLTFTPTMAMDLFPLPDATRAVSTDFGYTQYKPTGLTADTVIDGTDSTSIINVSKNANPTPSNTCASGSLQTQFFPVDIQSAGADFWIYHWRINGVVPQDSDWSSTYCGSGTSFRFQNCPGPNISNGGPTISDVRIDRTWDAIRFIYSNNWTVQRVYASFVRDDAIENDVQEGGSVIDCLFDGCLNFMACDPSSNLPQMSTQQHILLDGVLVRLRLSWQGDATQTHGSFFKYATDSWESNNPRLTIKNCVFAIEDVTHNGFSRMNAAWDQLEATGHSNNYLVNLSNVAMPGNYPFPPGNANFTIINQNGASQATALSFWADARDDWKAAHPHLPT